MPSNPSGDDNLAGNPFVDSEGDVHLNGTTAYIEAAQFVFAEATVKSVAMTAAIEVTIPDIADQKADSVAVVIGDDATFEAAVGDAVIALPQEALPTDCILAGAYVTDDDTVTVTFGTKEGGGGVSSAGIDFKFLLIDVT